MSGTEQAIAFACGDETLVGILSLPPAASVLQRTGVVIVVGGPQYRIGSHRQFVRLARRLAGAGHAVMRFDARGMGDSTGAMRSFEQTGDDIAAAIDALMSHVPTLEGTVLWGLCDGASASLLYLHGHHDDRVRGLCLANPWVRSDVSLARTHVKHYYAQRLLQPTFWRKLLRGQVAGEAWRGLVANLRLARSGSGGSTAERARPYQDRMAAACATFGGSTLLLLSGDDYTAKEFVEFAAASETWTRALARSALRRVELPGADHTFSTVDAQREVEDVTLDWLARVAQQQVRAGPPAVTAATASP